MGDVINDKKFSFRTTIYVYIYRFFVYAARFVPDIWIAVFFWLGGLFLILTGFCMGYDARKEML